MGQERARELNIANVGFERRSLFDDGLGRDTYDAVLAFNILHLLEDARKRSDLWFGTSNGVYRWDGTSWDISLVWAVAPEGGLLPS